MAPALLIFLVPIIALLFFLHAQSSFDEDARIGIIEQVKSDHSLSAEERAQLIKVFEAVPVSQMMSDAVFASNFDKMTRFGYATFRWMIRLSTLSLLVGVVVLIFGGVCVLASFRSQHAQLLSLTASWHVLRIYSAIQTVILAVLLVALSFWVTALWINAYYPQLILIAGMVAMVLVGVVIAAIFKKPDMTFEVEGRVIEKEDHIPLWEELNRICEKVDTEPVDQVIAGIDDRFFVTENPITVDGKTYGGRSLFVSLSLLKHLDGSGADAVLAHEMAHFSGQDTLYSNKMVPLLARFDHYLVGLYEGGLTRPIFYFMQCFRALFELSIGKHSRQREFRADQIAADVTSPDAIAGALLKIAAYSRYRNTVEQELFNHEQELETANVSEQIDAGFQSFAVSFATDIDMVDLRTTHPFDSHPPLHKRFQALGIPFGSDNKLMLLETAGDSRWFLSFPDAEQLERDQWHAYENRFRDVHKQSLPYRYVPETDEEREVVVEAFPEITFTSFFKNSSQQTENLVIDYEKTSLSSWDAPIYFSQIIGCTFTEEGNLDIQYNGVAISTATLPLKIFGTLQQQKVLDAFNHYYSRYLSAAEYQKQKRGKLESRDV